MNELDQYLREFNHRALTCLIPPSSLQTYPIQRFALVAPEPAEGEACNWAMCHIPFSRRNANMSHRKEWSFLSYAAPALHPLHLTTE